MKRFANVQSKVTGSMRREDLANELKPQIDRTEEVKESNPGYGGIPHGKLMDRKRVINRREPGRSSLQRAGDSIGRKEGLNLNARNNSVGHASKPSNGGLDRDTLTKFNMHNKMQDRRASER